MTNHQIKPQHLKRQAIIYLRQSSFQQVNLNKESLALQYQLADRARALGWTDIVTIDDDLGVSANGNTERTGFKNCLKPLPVVRWGLCLAVKPLDCREMTLTGVSYLNCVGYVIR
ncbi:MAG: recombinase family protein [Gammaproteobacteria bacterium]|nr:recombinase family protein [Gammaproteobacteria bacterium]